MNIFPRKKIFLINIINLFINKMNVNEITKSPNLTMTQENSPEPLK